MMNSSDFLKQGYLSEFYSADYDPESYKINMALSERQLFTQSNLRVLLGQDNMGRFHFISLPHNKDFPIPTRRRKPSQHITACPGMFYQTDLTTFLGKMYYEIHTQTDVFCNGGDGSQTGYWNGFLPLTRTSHGCFSMNTFSIAPIMEKPHKPGLKSLPLPGPSGAIYGMYIKNNGSESVELRIILKYSDQFMCRYEHCGLPAEDRAYPAVYSQVDRNLLLMERPEGYTGLWMEAGTWKKNSENEYQNELVVQLAPGDEKLVETCVGVSQDSDGIGEAMSILYMHDADEWIAITDRFWKKYLGDLKLKIEGDHELAVKVRDMHIRNILDNFNCIQTNAEGRVLAHWQGAPSHCMGRMWGIDVEPTTLSFMHIFPELGEKLIEYMVDRNEPYSTDYEDHSTPIRMAPLVMAGEYLKDTGNLQYFTEHPEILKNLDEIWTKITGFCRQDCHLIPSRYSSDGIVMRRYDHGSNVKFWYASKCYENILMHLGYTEKAEKCRDFAAQLKKDIMTYMIQDGPFGKQFTGGTNLGEQGDFYMDEDFFYYDGEDSSSVLAPVYGIYPYDEEAWVNYHRFAGSLFCSNYDPEMKSLRWFPYGAAIDGTAYISQLGGAVTKKEMKTALQNMLQCAIDDTGSLYWWPRGINMRRMIARCSQGQGSWILQFMRQWLGIDYHADENLLIITPRGLLNGYEWKGATLGNARFDIQYEETSERASLTVTNYHTEKIHIRFGVRAYGTGATEQIRYLEADAESGIPVTLSTVAEQAVHEEEFSAVPYILKTAADEDGILLKNFGFKQPGKEMFDNGNRFLLRWVLGNNLPDDLTDVTVNLTLPEGAKAGKKEYLIWDDLTELKETACEIYFDRIGTKELKLLQFWVEMPEEYEAAEVWFDAHPFFFGEKKKDGKLWITSSDDQCRKTSFVLTVSYCIDGKAYRKIVEIPVESKPFAEFREFSKTFLGALGE